MTQIGNWGGGGEIALNIHDGSNVNEAAWLELVNAVFSRVDLGSAARVVKERFLEIYFVFSESFGMGIVFWRSGDRSLF